jgi:predicted O-methyltransferase YrrM
MRPSLHYLCYSLGLAPAESQTNPTERSALARHAKGKTCVVEIGVYQGLTGAQLRAAMSPSGEYYAVDPYPRGRLGISFTQRVADREVSRVRNGKIVWIRELGKDAASKFREMTDRPVDFLFIDGDHSYEGLRGDWEAWSPLVAADGIVALHDSHSTPTRQIDDAGSVRFTNDVILKDLRFERLQVVDSATILRRKLGHV